MPKSVIGRVVIAMARCGAFGVLAGVCVLSAFAGCNPPTGVVSGEPSNRSREAKSAQLERATFEVLGFCRSIAFSPDGQLLASGTQGHLFLCDLRTGRAEELEGGDGNVSSVAFSPDGTTLGAGTTSGMVDHCTVKLWNVGARAESATLTYHAGGSAYITWVAFSPNGETLATADNRGNVRFWDLASHRDRVVFQVENSRLVSLTKEWGKIRSITFSPDGNTLAIAVHGGVILWDVQEERERTILSTGAGTRRMAFTPDGDRLAVIGKDVSIWNVSSLRRLQTVKETHTGHPRCMAFSPDGCLLVIGIGGPVDRPGRVVVYEAVSARELTSFPCHSANLTDLAFSPDGKLLATGSLDRTVKLWDVAKILPELPIGDRPKDGAAQDDLPAQHPDDSNVGAEKSDRI